jgi:hypothetical protein
VGAGAAEGEANEMPDNSMEMEGIWAAPTRQRTSLFRRYTRRPPLAAAAGKSRRVRTAECRAGDDEARTALEEERDGLLAAWPVRRVRLLAGATNVMQIPSSSGEA